MACALPNFYSTAHLMTTCGDGQANERLEFGFNATFTQVINTHADRVRFDLNGSATTKHGFIAGCSTLTLDGLRASAIDLQTTTSSCTARPLVSVVASASD